MFWGLKLGFPLINRIVTDCPNCFKVIVTYFNRITISIIETAVDIGAVFKFPDGIRTHVTEVGGESLSDSIPA